MSSVLAFGPGLESRPSGGIAMGEGEVETGELCKIGRQYSRFGLAQWRQRGSGAGMNSLLGIHYDGGMGVQIWAVRWVGCKEVVVVLG